MNNHCHRDVNMIQNIMNIRISKLTKEVHRIVEEEEPQDEPPEPPDESPDEAPGDKSREEVEVEGQEPEAPEPETQEPL